MFAEAFSRPNSPAVQTLFGYTGPRMFGVLGRWFDAEIQAGRIRELPTLVLIQLLLDPLMIHLFMRPLAAATPAVPLPDIDALCDVFADAFIRSVTLTAA